MLLSAGFDMILPYRIRKSNQAKQNILLVKLCEPEDGKNDKTSKI